jgi:hydrogenase maturation protease
MNARIVGLGQRLAGDDGVGLAIVDRLRALGAPSGVELVEASDAGELLTLLETARPVIVVDAIVGAGPPGEVVDVDAAQIGGACGRPLLSSHGLDVCDAIELARTLFGQGASPQVRVVGVRIAPPARGTCGLSPTIDAAVARAAAAVLARLAREAYG